MNKSKLLGLLSIVLIATVLFFSGCDTSSGSNAKVNDDPFVIVSYELYYQVVYDSTTKVMYVMSDSSYNQGNFTMLVNADGSPRLYKEDKNGLN